jgi:hypothetical protein
MAGPPRALRGHDIGWWIVIVLIAAFGLADGV